MLLRNPIFCDFSLNTPTKCSDAQPLVNLGRNTAPRKRIENRGMPCNSLWIPTFVISIQGQNNRSFAFFLFV